MPNDKEADALLTDFQQVLRRVSEEVSRAAVIPAVGAVQEQWTKRLDEINRTLASVRDEAVQVRDQIMETRTRIEKTQGWLETNTESVLKATKEAYDGLSAKVSDLVGRLVQKTETAQVLLANLESVATRTESALNQFGESANLASTVLKRAAGFFQKTCQGSAELIEKTHSLTLQQTQQAEAELKEVLSKATAEKQDFSHRAAALGHELTRKQEDMKELMLDASKGFKSLRRSLALGLFLLVVVQLGITLFVAVSHTKGWVWW